MNRIKLIIVLRKLYRRRFFTSINILSLTIGITSALVVFLFARHDFSFDQHHRDKDRIYRIVSHIGKPPDVTYVAGVPMPLADAIRSHVKGVEVVVPLYTLSSDLKVSIPRDGALTEHKKQSNVVYTPPEFFSVFNYKWLAGSPEASLKEPYQVVLTKKTANRYFPGFSADGLIGKRVILKDSVVTTVSGLVDDPAGNTDLTFQVFVSFATAQTPRLRHALYSNWSVTVPFSQLFIKLQKNQSLVDVKDQLNKVYRDFQANAASGVGTLITTYQLWENVYAPMYNLRSAPSYIDQNGGYFYGDPMEDWEY